MDTKLDTNFTVNFFLRNGKNGSTIICSVPSLSKLRTATGITIAPALWDENRQRCKGKLPIVAKINASLSDWEKKINESLIEGQAMGEDAAHLKARVLAVLGKAAPAPKRTNLFLPFFYEWVYGTATKTNYRKSDLYSYNLFRQFTPEDMTFDDVDYNYYGKALEYMRSQNLKENTVGTHIRNLKAVMNEAYKRGLHNNTAFMRFKKPQEESDTVYLTAEELQSLKDITLSGHLEKARDMFLLGCYTAMRYSDYSRISKDWIKDNNIVFTEEKTGNRNSIPLSASAKAIIDKYGGAPRLSQQKLNDYIKDVCRLAGITDKVEVTYTKGGKEHKETREKWELVSTHTARRTGATLLIKAGAPIAWVMRVTGHKSEKTFMRYIRLSAEEYADLVRGFVEKI